MPAIVSCIDDEKAEKLSLVLLDDEEEKAEDSKEIKELKEVKIEFIPVHYELHFAKCNKIELQIADVYQLVDYSIDTSLYLLPPELV